MARGLEQLPLAPAPAPEQPTPTLSGETVRHSSGMSVPREFYDLTPQKQQRFLELKAADQEQEKDQSQFNAVALQLLDLRDRDSAKVQALEAQVATLTRAVEMLQQRLDATDTTLEIQRSDELQQQQVELAQMTVNLQAVGAEQEANHQRRVQESEAMAIDHQARLQVTEQEVSTLEGQLKSSSALMLERGNAVEQQLAAMEPKTEQLSVKQTEISDGIASNAKTLKAFTGYDLEGAISSEVRRTFDQELEPQMEALIKRRYVVTQSLTGSDGYDPKPEGYDEAFLASQMTGTPPGASVDRALKKSKRRRR